MKNFAQISWELENLKFWKILNERLDPDLCDVAPVRQCDGGQSGHTWALVMTSLIMTTDVVQHKVGQILLSIQ